MKNIIKTVGVLIFKKDKVLLVCHGEKAGHLNNTYGLPAGRVEEGETFVEAGIRELEEETGLITENKYLRKIDKVYKATIERKDGIKNFSQDNFLCNYFEGELKPNNETVPYWVEIKKLDTVGLLPNVKEMIFDALELKKTIN